jgi:hypothetical protein
MYAMWGKGKMYGGMFDRPAEMASMRPFWLCYIHVKDVGKAVEAATKGGAFVQRPRMDIPGGTIAILGDPQGAGFAVHDQMVSAAGSNWTPEGDATAAAKPAGKSATQSKAKSASTSRAATKKSSAKKSSAKKSSAKKSSAKKSSAKKAPAKRAAGKKTSAKTSAGKKASAKKGSAKKASPRKSAKRRR